MTVIGMTYISEMFPANRRGAPSRLDPDDRTIWHSRDRLRCAVLHSYGCVGLEASFRLGLAWHLVPRAGPSARGIAAMLRESWATSGSGCVTGKDRDVSSEGNRQSATIKRSDSNQLAHRCAQQTNRAQESGFEQFGVFSQIHGLEIGESILLCASSLMISDHAIRPKVGDLHL